MESTVERRSTISDLRPGSTVVVEKGYKDGSMGYGMHCGGMASAVLWFIIIAVIVFVVIWAIKPLWSLKSNGVEIDIGKVLIASIITALVIVFIIYLIKVSMVPYHY